MVNIFYNDNKINVTNPICCVYFDELCWFCLKDVLNKIIIKHSS